MEEYNNDDNIISKEYMIKCTKKWKSRMSALPIAVLTSHNYAGFSDKIETVE
jgi:hypothetical protein